MLGTQLQAIWNDETVCVHLNYPFVRLYEAKIQFIFIKIYIAGYRTT